MEKILRIGYNRYYNDEVFASHIEFIKKNASSLDGVLIFAEFSHYGYWSLEYSAENAALLKKRIAAYREAGIKRIGINLLCTVGHTEESWDVLPRSPYQYAVNYDGTQSLSCLCPSNDEFLDYVKKRYALYAETGADELWLDDDLRLINHGVALDVCYCPKCLARFNSENGTFFTREQLVLALLNDEKVKMAWDKFKNDTMCRVFTAIKEGIRKVNADIDIGFMACDLDIKTEWVSSCGAKFARPGGGFWGDEHPIELFDKMFKVQRQIKIFPESVEQNLYEYESFPYEWIQRSDCISEIESALSLISGCDGVIYSPDIFNDKQSCIDMIAKNAKKWDTLAAVNKKCTPCGVYCVSPENARYLGEVGIPTTPYLEKACAVMMLGDEWSAYTDAEIKSILDKNVYTDGKGLEILHKRGFGHLCGGAVAAVKNSGMAQRFSDDELNGEYKNYYRDVFMNFFYGMNSFAYELKPSKDSQTVAYLEAVTHTNVGISAYKYENNGRKFFCDGYPFLDRAKTNAKIEQLINVFEWLSNGTLPVVIKKAVKVIPVTASDGNGGLNIMLTNASYDATGEIEIEINTDKEIALIDENGNALSVNQRKDSGNVFVTVDNLNPWSYVLLTNKI